MAWGMYGAGSYREPAPRRLSLEELLGTADFQPSPRPAPITSLRDLDDEDRRKAQQGSLWAGMASLGALLSGDQRRAAAGMGDIQDAQDRTLASANARRESAWEQENAEREQGFAHQKREQEAKALYGMYERAVEGEDLDGPYAKRAETAARMGSMSELEKLADPETKGKRNFVRSRGGNPDIWEDNLRKQEELRNLLSQEKAAADWEGEKGRLTEKEKIESDAALALRKAQRDAGVLWQPPQYEPLARVAARAEMLERIHAKYREAAGGGAKGVTRIGQLADGSWAEIHRADETHPKPYAVPIDGQPEVRGNLAYYTKDSIRYVHDKNRPEAGAYPLEEHEEGSLPPAVRPGPPIKGPGAGPKSGDTGAPKSGDGGGGSPVVGQQAPASAEAATKKLAAVKNRGRQQQIAAARASGYSDSEIAAFLGLL